MHATAHFSGFGNFRRAGALFAFAVLLSGCASNGGSVAPLSYAATPGNSQSIAGNANQLLAALHGGVLPADSVSHLSRSDQLRALEAEYKALESAPGGSPVPWKSFDGSASGTVTAATPYQVGQQNCRQYTHEAVIKGQSISGQGAACRNGDGSWTPLT